MTIKILHIIDNMGIGGAQRILEGILKTPQKKIEIMAFALRRNIPQITNENVIVYPAISRFSLVPLLKLIKLVRSQNVRILHCHLFRSLVYGWLIKAFFIRDIKLIFHDHGDIFIGKFFSFAIRVLTCMVDLHVAVSQSVKNELIHKCGIHPDRIKVLYNFASTKRPQSAGKDDVMMVKKAYGIDPAKRLIGFIGRLSPIKSVDTLLRALPLLGNNDVQVVIVGTGPEEILLKKLTKQLGLQDKVIFTGYVSDIVKIYAMLDILVVPSRSEGCPMVFLESRIFGIPIVASDVPALNELIQHGRNGLLFRFRDHVSLSLALKALLEDRKQWMRLKKNSENEADRYSNYTYVKCLFHIYKELSS